MSQDQAATSNTSGLEPQGHAVLVKPYVPELGRGRIQLPPSVQATQVIMDQRAIVVEVGLCAWDDEPKPRAAPGDHVLITKFSGFMAHPDITLDGETYRLVNDRDIFCKITPKE